MISKISGTNQNNQTSFGSVKYRVLKPSSVRKLPNIDYTMHSWEPPLAEQIALIKSLTKEVKQGIFSHFKMKKIKNRFVESLDKMSFDRQNNFKADDGRKITIPEGTLSGAEIIEIASKKVSDRLLPEGYKPYFEPLQDVITIEHDSNIAEYFDALKKSLIKVKDDDKIRLLNKLSNDIVIGKFKSVFPEKGNIKPLSPDDNYIFKSKHGRIIKLRQDSKRIELVSRKGISTVLVNRPSTSENVKEVFNSVVVSLHKIYEEAVK